MIGWICIVLLAKSHWPAVCATSTETMWSPQELPAQGVRSPVSHPAHTLPAVPHWRCDKLPVSSCLRRTGFL